MRTIADSPLLTQFADVTRTSAHGSVPEDWYVLVCDIQGSTQAIADGRYKDVNVVGASSIIAVCNAVGEKNVAYVFGGDGATFLVDAPYKDAAVQALLGTRILSRDSFQLSMRVGVVPVRDLKQKGHDVRMARFQFSRLQTQTVLSGDGIKIAEDWIKAPGSNPYLAEEPAGGVPPANFEGLECRWEPLQSRRGETITILVQAFAGETYESVIRKVETIFGESRDSSPVQPSNLKLTTRLSRLLAEAKVRTHSRGGLFSYLIKNYLITVVFKALGMFRDSYAARYRQEVIENSDYRKFDGTLRMVLDGTRDQRELLELFLEASYQKHELAFGVHVSDSALMTCLIFERSKGQHMHFVDGSRGGYAEAAKSLKVRLKTLAAVSPAKSA